MNRDATGLAGTRIKTYDTLGSTNAEALALARAGERGPLWITAHSQSAGRGRRGSAWASPPGNLYATLLLTDPASPALAPQLSFVAVLAAHDAVAAVAPALASRLAVKWPNDLLLDGAKVGGILLESENGPHFAVAVGIGVNCVSHPSGTPFAATDLAVAGAPVTAEQLLAVLTEAMGRRLGEWRGGAGFAAIRAGWLERAAGLGQPIQVRLPERKFSGRFEGLDETGRLLVAEEGIITTVTAGEVFGFPSGHLPLSGGGKERS
jgi:BirA family biotin operon repressor/biotin-[acetyl-CoA-carboxylase] ligase